MNRYLESYSPKARTAHYILDLVVVLLCSLYSMLDMQHAGLASFLTIGMVGFSFAHVPMMLLAGLFGYVHSMIFVVVLLVWGIFLDIQSCYQVFVFLLICGLTHALVRNGWCGKLWKAILAAVLSALLLGNGWYLLSCLISDVGFSQVNLIGQLMLFELMLPECLLVYIGLYLFFRFAPDKIKGFFHVGYYYTSAYQEEKSAGKIRHTFLGRHILQGLILDLVVILISAIVLAGLLFQALSDEPVFEEKGVPYQTSEDIFSNSKDGFFGSMDDLYQMREEYRATGELVPGTRLSRSNSYAAFCIKLAMMMSAIIIPVIILTYYAAEYMAVEPLRRISDFMGEYAGVSDERKTELLRNMPMIEPKIKDEIWDVYHSLLIMLGNMNRYMAKIKEDQQIEAELEASRQANAAKTSFLSNMSHEIRTPINAVLGMDEVILRESKEENTLLYARDIQSAGKTLLALINDILDFSKIESGKMEIIPTEYDIRAMMEELVNMVGFRARGKGLNLDAKINPKTPRDLYGDELRLKQIIINILTNAVKYTEKGYVTLSLDYEKLDKKHIILKVKVKDTGIGIKSEDLEKLFAPFERIDEKRNLTIEGSGLGMSIVRSLLFMMGSSLDVKSTYGHGSEFSFEVVQEVLSWNEVGSVDLDSGELRPRKRYRETFRAPNAKILVVDDTTTNHLVMKGLLKSTRVKIDTADSGSEALYLMKTNHYHMLFIDHRMPEMDGVEVLHRLLAMDDNPNLDTPAIAMTANVVSGAREMYLENGFWDYLSKPVDGQKLEEMMITYLPPELIEIPREGDMEEPEEQVIEEKGEEPVTEIVEAPEESRKMPDAPEPSEASDLQSIEGINYEDAVQNCGDEEVLREIMVEYRTVIEEKAAEIEQYFNEKDYENYTIQVHALKSSSRIIGAMELSKQAEYLEKCGNEGNEAEIEKLTPGLLALYRSYQQRLAGVKGMDEEEEEEKPLLSAEGFLSAMDDLKELLLVYDYDNADEIMEQLKKYQIPDEFQEKYDRIKVLMAEVDRDRLLEVL